MRVDSAPAATIRPTLALIVDDDPMMRLLASQAMEQIGLRVVAAASGEEGLEHARREPPDIVLLDVQMPGINGFDVCAALRSNPLLRHLPILMMTGREDTESVSLAYESGATDFVTKPIQWQLLGHRVRYLLRSASAFREVSESRAQLARSRSLLADAHRVARLASWEWTRGDRAISWSDESERIFGGALELPHSARDYFARVHPGDVELVRSTLARSLHYRHGQRIEHRILDSEEDIRLIEVQIEPRLDPLGRYISGLHGTMRDLTERWRAEQKIQQLAYYDPLTNLPNRQHFKQRATAALNAAAGGRASCGLLFIDLDRFKRVNDTLGHSAGDQLLRIVADRLQGALRGRPGGDRPGDLLGRLAGDEFVAVVCDVSDRAIVLEVAQRLRDALRAPASINGEELFISASIGVSVFPEDGVDYEELLGRADSAMYDAKNGRRGIGQPARGPAGSGSCDRLSVERDFRRALERQDELVMYFQPQVDAAAGKLHGVEALVRWQHPTRGLLLPGEFMAVIEEARLLPALNGWVLEAVCRSMNRWRDSGLVVPRVAVNVSAQELEDPEFPERFRGVIASNRLRADAFALEITENVLLRHAETTMRTLQALRSQGARLAIDDFGTGYSSLAYLRRFPLDQLKIDRAFVADLPADGAITLAIIRMAGSLGLEILAEGVESEAQARFLRENGCNLMQGYLFHRPMPAEQLASLLGAAPELAMPAGGMHRGLRGVAVDCPAALSA